MRRKRWLAWLAAVLIVVGAAQLGYYYWLQDSAVNAEREARQWLNQAVSNRQPGLPTPAPVPERVHHGDVIGELIIPRLRLSVMVFEGADGPILRVGAGHIPDTALPQNSGNVGIAAHRDTYFRPLRFIQPNDVISLRTPHETVRYSVTNIEIVQPGDIGALAEAPGRDLTLVTCYPFYYVGSAPQRFIVHARRIA